MVIETLFHGRSGVNRRPYFGLAPQEGIEVSLLAMAVEKLMWLDLEMTGLNVEIEVIIEAAAIITDLNFNRLADYHSVVRQPQRYLDNMDEWNTKHHGESGLTEKVPSGTPPEEVEAYLVEMAEVHFGDEPVILAGNSIGQDRAFLEKYFKNFSKKLHYRMLDVSSWKIIFNNCYDLVYPKNTSHRALDDIIESIGELQFYLDFLSPDKIKGHPKSGTPST